MQEEVGSWRKNVCLNNRKAGKRENRNLPTKQSFQQENDLSLFKNNPSLQM